MTRNSGNGLAGSDTRADLDSAERQRLGTEKIDKVRIRNHYRALAPQSAAGEAANPRGLVMAGAAGGPAKRATTPAGQKPT